MNNPINYRNKKPYKTAKYPIRQPIYLTWLIQFLSQMMLTGKKYELEKVGMEGIEPPYVLLSNHMSFIDFELVSDLTYPRKVYVCFHVPSNEAFECFIYHPLVC